MFLLTLEGLSTVPVSVYVYGRDVLEEDGGVAMSDALEKELIEMFEAGGYRSGSPAATHRARMWIEVRIEALDDLPEKALFELSVELFDHGRLEHGPDRSVELVTWSIHEAEVTEVEGAKARIEERVRAIGREFLLLLDWANGRPRALGRGREQ